MLAIFPVGSYFKFEKISGHDQVIVCFRLIVGVCYYYLKFRGDAIRFN